CRSPARRRAALLRRRHRRRVPGAKGVQAWPYTRLQELFRTILTPFIQFGFTDSDYFPPGDHREPTVSQAEIGFALESSSLERRLAIRLSFLLRAGNPSGSRHIYSGR